MGVQKNQYGNKATAVPAAPIVAVVEKWMWEHRTVDGHVMDIESEQLSAEGILTPLQRVVNEIWGSEESNSTGTRVLFRLLHEGQQWVQFDLADLIVTKLIGAMAWYTEPELAEAYASVDLNALDYQRPTSEVVHQQMQEQTREAYMRLGGSVNAVSRELSIGFETAKKLIGEEVLRAA